MLAYRVRRPLATKAGNFRAGQFIDPEVFAAFPDQNRKALLAVRDVELVDVPAPNIPAPVVGDTGSKKWSKR